MTNSKSKKMSIIVPCYNEEEVLPIFYKEVTKVLKTINCSYELILVNDGSRDNTLKVMADLANNDKNIFYLSFSRNFGKESAMYAGLTNATGDYIGFMDADLQHPPWLLIDMYKKIQNIDCDCVACRRVNRVGDAKIRTFFARFFYKIINKISDVKLIDGAGDYRLMKKEMVDAIISMSEYNRFSKGIFSWVGFNTYWIEYQNVERVAGKTSWSFVNLVKYAIDGVVNFTNAPLDVAALFGLLFAIIAFIYLIVVIVKYAIFGDPVQGWPTIICLILIIGGIQLFSIGIIGQYIGKTYLEVKNRPHYIVSKTNRKNCIKIR